MVSHSPVLQKQQEPTVIKGDIPASLHVESGMEFLFISKDQRALTHGIHKYPAKFFPELPRWIIERYSDEGDSVLDPFVGSGTTCLEASLLGRKSVGIDVDPFSRFLARVKTTPISNNELDEAWTVLSEHISHYSDKVEVDLPEFPYRDNWFKPHSLKELGYIREQINQLKATERVRNFLLVCFSSIVRRVSEADDNCTRTVIRKNLNKQVVPMQAINLFLSRAEKQVENMKELYALAPQGRVVIPDDCDARNIPMDDESVELAVTSPPYLNAVDYPRTHQLEMYWLGFTSGSLQPLKKQHIGTEAVSAHEYAELSKTGCAEADEVIQCIYEVDPRRAYIAAKYLDDMFANLDEVYRVLKRGGYYVIVVGNNLVRGYEFETWRYLLEYANASGYEIEAHFVSKIINHFIKIPRKQRINDDYVLVLRK